jgi:hypothetical protein
MSILPDFSFDIKQCLFELDDFKTLLDSDPELSEKKDILPFFSTHPNLSAYISSLFPEISVFNKLKHEFSIYQDFRCDLVAGDSISKTYCFIEFEDARNNSIFIQGQRQTPEWAPRFEKGYSQIIDWFWKLEEMQSTGDYTRKFGEDSRYYGLLVIGRSGFLDSEKKTRLRWRMKKVIINSMPVYCMTFDANYKYPLQE